MTDSVATIAGWLADQRRWRIPLGAFNAVLEDPPRGRRFEAADLDAADEVLAALDRLAAAGLIVIIHGLPRVVSVLDRDGLRSVAANPGPTRIGD